MSDIPIDLDAIRAREAAATEGPWTIWRDEDDVDNSVISTDQRWFEDGGQRYYGSRQIAVLAEGNLNEADAEFIAYARTDVPALLAEVDEYRALFEMQWKRMGEATERWRAEDPAARELIMPDLGDLLQWLMDDADRARAEAEALRVTGAVSARVAAKETAA